MYFRRWKGGFCGLHRRALPAIVVFAALACLVGATPEGIAATPTLKPTRGATVSEPPTLRWQRVPRARFYNVQVYRDGRKILSRWPRKARFELHWRWKQGDRTVRFRSGVYRWYVWPHYRTRYGRLIVRTWFQAGQRPKSLTAPKVAGDPREGALLTASPGKWTGTKPIGLAYRWQRCGPRGRSCVDIAGERAPTRILTAADIDATVRVVVTASNWLGRRSAASTPTAVVLPVPPILVAPPQIRGRPQVGRTLTSDVGAWTSSRPLTYKVRWELCGDTHCRSISGSPGRSLLLRASALERHVQVVVTATNPGGSTRAVSPPTDRVGLTLEGTNEEDRLVGTAGSDLLLGKGGDDWLGGTAGPDVLVGGRGEDRYRAGAGADQVKAKDGRRDVIHCGGGADVAVVDRNDRVGDHCEVVRRR